MLGRCLARWLDSWWGDCGEFGVRLVQMLLYRICTTDCLVQLVQIVCGTAGGDGEMMVDGLRWSQQPSAASFTSLDLSFEILHLFTLFTSI